MVPGMPGGGYRKDLFGFIDIIALDPERGVLAVQSCGQSFKAHVDKIMDSECTENVIEWLKSPSKPKLECWGWRKVKLRMGSKAMRWRPRVAEVFLNENGELSYVEGK